jgi:hypothetical protein
VFRLTDAVYEPRNFCEHVLGSKTPIPMVQLESLILSKSTRRTKRKHLRTKKNYPSQVPSFAMNLK